MKLGSWSDWSSARPRLILFLVRLQLLLLAPPTVGGWTWHWGELRDEESAEAANEGWATNESIYHHPPRGIVSRRLSWRVSVCDCAGSYYCPSMTCRRTTHWSLACLPTSSPVAVHWCVLSRKRAATVSLSVCGPIAACLRFLSLPHAVSLASFVLLLHLLVIVQSRGWIWLGCCIEYLDKRCCSHQQQSGCPIAGAGMVVVHGRRYNDISRQNWESRHNFPVSFLQSLENNAFATKICVHTLRWFFQAPVVGFIGGKQNTSLWRMLPFSSHWSCFALLSTLKTVRCWPVCIHSNVNPTALELNLTKWKTVIHHCLLFDVSHRAVVAMLPRLGRCCRYTP